MAKQHINELHNKNFINNSIVIFGRDYPSYDMFDYLNEKGLFFLMRVSSSFKMIQAISSEDCAFEYKSKGRIEKIKSYKNKTF